MHAVLLFLLCGVTPIENSVQDEVDLVEINHFHDEKGRLVFDQIIFYDWCPIQHRYNVRDWRLLKNMGQIPVRDWRTGQFVAVWHDFKEKNVLRTVRAASVRESWTQYDPELVEREFLAQEKRRELTKLAVRSDRAAPTAATENRLENSSHPSATEPPTTTSRPPAGATPSGTDSVSRGPAANQGTAADATGMNGRRQEANLVPDRSRLRTDGDHDLPLPRDEAAVVPR
jgi:hypothetical protein